MIERLGRLATAAMLRLRRRSQANTEEHRIYGYRGQFRSWSEACEGISGYASSEIAARVASAAEKVLSGESVYERDSVNFDHIEYAFPIVTGLLWHASVAGKLNVLDFGGGMGTTFLQTRHLLAHVENLTWTIVEQTGFVEHGRRIFRAEPKIQFYQDIDEAVDACKPDVVIVSSSLQYVPDPYLLISKLVATEADVILIDRTIVSQGSTDEITRQYVDPTIFPAIIPTWILSEQKLTAAFGRKYHLLARFPATASTEKLDIEGRNFSELGFIFVKRGSRFDPETTTEWCRNNE